MFENIIRFHLVLLLLLWYTMELFCSKLTKNIFLKSQYKIIIPKHIFVLPWFTRVQ